MIDATAQELRRFVPKGCSNPTYIRRLTRAQKFDIAKTWTIVCLAIYLIMGWLRHALYWQPLVVLMVLDVLIIWALIRGTQALGENWVAINGQWIALDDVTDVRLRYLPSGPRAMLKDGSGRSLEGGMAQFGEDPVIFGAIQKAIVASTKAGRLMLNKTVEYEFGLHEVRHGSTGSP